MNAYLTHHSLIELSHLIRLPFISSDDNSTLPGREPLFTPFPISIEPGLFSRNTPSVKRPIYNANVLIPHHSKHILRVCIFVRKNKNKLGK